MTVAGRYALQLRDDRPDIAAPGHWALFGGSLDGDETPRLAVRREIREALALDVTDWRELWRVRYYVPFREPGILEFIFAADVTSVRARRCCHGGQAPGPLPT